jgi:hypothetical protein
MVHAQDYIPFDSAHWEIQARQYVTENYYGYEAIYLNQGIAVLKDTEFLNGSIEFDVYLKDRRGFPGVSFRAYDDSNMELFYFRPHLSGQTDDNQATPVFNGLTGWQLYFGPSYSFVYDYDFDTWTHVKLVVNGKKAQIYLDHASKPNFSWNLKQAVTSGKLALGGSFAPVHYANFKFDPLDKKIVDFEVVKPEPVDGLVKSWMISDRFEEDHINEIKLDSVIDARKWIGKIDTEENNAANISRISSAPGPDGNTVFAKIIINAQSDQQKLFEFGYSDRVVAILNGKRLYKGDNSYKSRDYRYLGTIGFFDAIYLDLKKGDNTLLLAIAESFGGWGVTGRFNNYQGIEIRTE